MEQLRCHTRFLHLLVVRVRQNTSLTNPPMRIKAIHLTRQPTGSLAFSYLGRVALRCVRLSCHCVGVFGEAVPSHETTWMVECDKRRPITVQYQSERDRSTLEPDFDGREIERHENEE